MFGLETIRDALINFSAGTPSGQAYLANQREAAQQAQLFPLQLQMAQAQAAKAQQDIETQGLKSKALAGVLSRIGGGGQQQQQQQTPQLSAQELINLSFVDPEMAKSAIDALAETRYQQQAAMPKPEVYAIDPNTGNLIMLQPPQPGIQSMLSFGNGGSPAPAPTQTGQIAQALGNMPGRPPVTQEPLTPLPSPLPQSNREVIRNSSDEFGAQIPLNAGGAQNVLPPNINGLNVPPTSTPPIDGFTPNTGGVVPVAQLPDAPLPTATVAGQPYVDNGNIKSDQEGINAASKEIGKGTGLQTLAQNNAFTLDSIPKGRIYDNARRIYQAGDPLKAAEEIAKIDEGKFKVQSSMKTLDTKTKIVLGEIDKAFKIIGYNPETRKRDFNYVTTGVGGNIAKRANSASDAASLENRFKTIRGQIGLGELQELRNNSPTGGALGDVSNRDIDMLQSVLGTFTVEQKTQDTIDNLLRLQEIVKGRKDTFNNAFAKDFLGETAAPQADDVIQLDDYMRQQ